MRRTQTHSDALRRTQTHSDALRRTQTQSDAIRLAQSHLETTSHGKFPVVPHGAELGACTRREAVHEPQPLAACIAHLWGRARRRGERLHAGALAWRSCMRPRRRLRTGARRRLQRRASRAGRTQAERLGGELAGSACFKVDLRNGTRWFSTSPGSRSGGVDKALTPRKKRRPSGTVTLCRTTRPLATSLGRTP